MTPTNLTLPSVVDFLRRFDAQRGMEHTPDYSEHIAKASAEQLCQWLSDGHGGPEFLDAVAAEIYARKNAGRN